MALLSHVGAFSDGYIIVIKLLLLSNQLDPRYRLIVACPLRHLLLDLVKSLK